MSTHILPDSRPREPKDVIRGPDGKNHIRIYCANCGKPWGLVPEEHITFAFALCDPCAEKHGNIAHMYKEPDAVFWERIQDLKDLPKLQKEWHTRVLKTQR